MNFYLSESFLTDTPSGDEQCDREYCIFEDMYEGTYYIKVEDSDKYVGYNFNV